MDFGTVFLCLFIIIGVIAVSVILFVRLNDMKKTYDDRLVNIVSDVNVGMSNAASYDKLQQSQLDSLKTGLSNVGSTWDSNFATFKDSLAQSIDTKTFKSSTIYAANGVIIGPSNNVPITYSNSKLYVPNDVVMGGLTLSNSVIVSNSNVSTLIENASGASKGNRYGIANIPAGQVKFYAPDDVSTASLSLSFAKADGTYADSLVTTKVPTGFQTKVSGALFVDNVVSGGRLNIAGSNDIYVSASNGMVISKDGGASGNLNVQGNAKVDGNLCIQSSCLTKPQLDRLILVAASSNIVV